MSAHWARGKHCEIYFDERGILIIPEIDVPTCFGIVDCKSRN
jgi:hypothetical protein